LENIYQFKIFSKFDNLIHFVTKRDISKPLENSLALHTGQESSSILKNREDISDRFDNMEFILANQTHSSNIEIIKDKKSRGWKDKKSAIRDCDSLITNTKGLFIGVLTADCVPILIFDPNREVIGAVHAGWRGTKDKIVKKSIEAIVKEFNSNPKDILVGVAPSIRGCCYEVDFNVAKHFLEYKGSIVNLKNGKYMLDLAKVNIAQLIEAGVLEINIEDSKICTCCDFDNYFSYRKTKCSGRFLSAIGLK